jgi:hypothetical protein
MPTPIPWTKCTSARPSRRWQSPEPLSQGSMGERLASRNRNLIDPRAYKGSSGLASEYKSAKLRTLFEGTASQFEPGFLLVPGAGFFASRITNKTLPPARRVHGERLETVPGLSCDKAEDTGERRESVAENCAEQCCDAWPENGSRCGLQSGDADSRKGDDLPLYAPPCPCPPSELNSSCPSWAEAVESDLFSQKRPRPEIGRMPRGQSTEGPQDSEALQSFPTIPHPLSG